MFNIENPTCNAYWQLKYDDVIFNDIFYRHMHNNLEIHLIVRGSGTFVLDGGEIQISPYDLIIIPPHCYHVFDVNKKVPYERIVFNFPVDYYGMDLFSIIDKPRIHNLSSHYEIIENFEKIRELNETYDAKDFINALHLYVQLILLQLKNTKFDIGPSRTANQITASVLEYIDEHLFEKLDVAVIAKALYVSKSHLQNTFYKSMKIGLKSYIIRRKMDKAQMLINEGNKASKVSLKLGYKTYSTFYKSYKNIYGIPPNRVKKKKT